MAHDPTSSESDSTQGMFLASNVGSAAAKPDRSQRRRIVPTDSDATLVETTRAQIRELVHEVRKLGGSDCRPAEFYEGMLSRVVMALASVGGAVWVRDQEKAIRLECHVNLKQTALAEEGAARQSHGKLIERMFDSENVTLLPPATESANEAIGNNPTDHLLILGPVKVDGENVGVIEIFQRPGAGPATQRGYQRFLSQVCEINSEYLGREKLRSLQNQQRTWNQLDDFAKRIHRSLDVKETAYAIANEGRRLIECDRLSVAVMHGSRCVIKTVSGLDTIERRSEQVKSLGRLATAVVKSRTPLWYDGDDSKLPPRIESRIHDHVEKSHSRLTAVIPLFRVEKPDDGGDPFALANPETQSPVGALVIEQLNDASISGMLKQRAEVVAAHAQTALSNSIDHQNIFLMPLWKTVGKLTHQVRGRRLARVATVAGLVVALTAFLCLYPYPFSLGARGSLVPEQQTEVYAKLDGVLTDIHVSNTGDTVVQKGQLLATMASSTLELRIGDIEGRIAQAREELRFATDGKNNASDLKEETAYSFRCQRAQQTILNLENELQVLLKDRALLQIESPIDGQVVNWQVRQNLLRRPVRYGQHLMTIVPPDTQWLIELEMPERRLAHLTRAMGKSDELLPVSFSLLSWPGKEFQGELISVDQKLDVYSDEGNAALVKIRFSNDEIPSELLKSGTRISGKVQCGTRSIGYAMFYELIETVQSKWQFWF